MAKEYKGPVRIKDIAIKAGVSAGTVDRVLHGRGKVSLENERKVREAIVELEYEPNIMARSLAMSTTFEIAIIIPSYAKDSFWKAQFNGIEKALKYIKDFGFSIKVLEFNDQKHGDLLKHKEVLTSQNIDALLLAPTISDDAHELLDICDKMDIPYVLVNSNLARTDDSFKGYVGQDSFQSGILGAKLLSLTAGNDCTLGIFHMEKVIDYSKHILQKQKGFLSFFDNKEEPNVDIVIDKIPATLSKKSLTKSITKFLDSNPNTKGIFVTTSRIHYLVDVLNSLGRDDIVIVGFDLIKENILALNKYDRMMLINQNPELQAYTGLTSLFEYLLSKKTISLTQYLPLDVITKENVSAYIETDSIKHIFKNN